MIARRLRDKYARGEPITIENFVIDTTLELHPTQANQSASDAHCSVDWAYRNA